MVLDIDISPEGDDELECGWFAPELIEDFAPEFCMLGFVMSAVDAEKEPARSCFWRNGFEHALDRHGPSDGIVAVLLGRDWVWGCDRVPVDVLVGDFFGGIKAEFDS